MDLLVSWGLFPLALLAVFTGCGLAVRAAAGIRPSPALLPGIGLAAVICVASLTTAWDATAELTTPVAVVLALAGYAASWPPRRPSSPVTPALIAGVAVFLLYGAPVLFSGQATFAGYIKLDDTATWLALTDRVMEHGHSLSGLAPSTYEATLASYLGTGYPIGAFLPLGIGSQLVATDPAWTIQPYISLLAGLLAVSLAELARTTVRAGGLRAAIGFVAAQPALLVGYALWGGVKEVAAASLIGLMGALAVPLLGRRPEVRYFVPLVLAGVAVITVLDPGGAVWLAPIPLAALYLVWRRSPRAALIAAGILAAAAIVFVLTYVSGRGVKGISGTLTSESELGNLIHPLSAWQAFGIWPVGDFRVSPGAKVPTAIAIFVVIVAGGAAILGAVRARALAPVLYVGSAIAGCVAILLVASPWVDGKALAIVSPALLFTAALGVGWMAETGMRIEAVLAGLAIAAGVLTSNFLGYREVNLAPRDQLAELERIGHRIDGEGPTLMTEFQPYGVRHFLRDGDPENVSGLRRREIPLRGGKLLANGLSTDTDSIALHALLVYPTLVLRRSPSMSRPPAPYRLIERDDYYEVWQRPAAGTRRVIAHLPLGYGVDPAGLPDCGRVRALAARAPRGGVMAAASRGPVVPLELADTKHPSDWEQKPPSEFLDPDSEGRLSGRIFWPRRGRVDIWLGGGARSSMAASLDGAEAGELREQLNVAGQYLELGSAPARYGWNRVAIDYGGPDLHPGSAGGGFPIGPLVLTPANDEGRITIVTPRRARSLCGRRWDWIEVLGRGPES